MDQLLGKLTNLGYEFFGILLPGLIAEFFLLLFWGAVGELAPACTWHVVPCCTLAALANLIGQVNAAVGWAGLMLPLTVAYFFGHGLHWIGRKSGAPSTTTQARHRVPKALICRIPKQPSHSPNLDRLREAVEQRFRPPGRADPLTWVELYPVAKSYVLQRLNYSLLPTYQGKYTLHRSISTAGALLFWLSFLSLIGTKVALLWFDIPEPRWLFLTSLAVGGLILVWNFSGSYVYNWELWGNTVITESYSILYGPPHAKQNPEPAGNRSGDERN